MASCGTVTVVSGDQDGGDGGDGEPTPGDGDALPLVGVVVAAVVLLLYAVSSRGGP